MNNKSSIGKFGEILAEKYLLSKNFVILEKNWRYSHGEIDMICFFDKTLIFVEVKYRDSDEYGHPEKAVTKKKQSMIKKTADQFWFLNPQFSQIRFDIVAITKNTNGKFDFVHFEDAFF